MTNTKHRDEIVQYQKRKLNKPEPQTEIKTDQNQHRNKVDQKQKHK